MMRYDLKAVEWQKSVGELIELAQNLASVMWDPTSRSEEAGTFQTDDQLEDKEAHTYQTTYRNRSQRGLSNNIEKHSLGRSRRLH